MNQPFVKWGLISGVFSAFFSLSMYLVYPDGLFSMSLGLIPMVVLVFCMSQAVKEERYFQGGYISWGGAMKPSFLTGLIYMVIALMFTTFLMNVLDPTLQERQAELAIEMQENMMEMMGQEMTEEQIEMLKSGSPNTIMGMLMGLIAGVICWIFPISAIVSLVMQRKDPNEDLV